MDGNTSRRIRLDELFKICGIRRKMFSLYGPPKHRIPHLHPSRRTPRRSHHKQVGAELQNLLKNGKNVSAVVVDREAEHLGVRTIIVVAVGGNCVIARSDTDPTNAKANTTGIKYFLEEVPASGCRHFT